MNFNTMSVGLVLVNGSYDNIPGAIVNSSNR